MTAAHTLSFQTLDRHTRAELRASHAGETGAVWIYRGILFINLFRRDKQLALFAREHLATEKQHLEAFEALLPCYRGSVLLLLWILAGFITGALPALFGRKWVYYTVFSVESFVEHHYQQQIHSLRPTRYPAHREILALFEACQGDEVSHKEQALAALKTQPSTLLQYWGRLVGAGSAIAVWFARRL